MRSGQVLIVEDDIFLGQLLMEYLKNQGYEVKHCSDGRSGLQAAIYQHFDICVLDVMLPDLEGYELARRIREKKASQPLLFLTARSLKQDKLKGFAVGADDYIVKPFDEEELACRIQAIINRSQNTLTKSQQSYYLGDLQFTVDEQQLLMGDVTVNLTSKETKILDLLCAHEGQIVKRSDALIEVYGKSDYFLGRSFDVFISKLRKKLSMEPKIEIENVFKVGFRLKVQQQKPMSS